MFFLGISVSIIYRTKEISIKTDAFYNYSARVEEIPDEREKTYKIFLTITAFADNSNTQETDISLLSYFEKTENIKNIQTGDILEIN